MNTLILFLPEHPAADPLSKELAQSGVTVHLPDSWGQAARLCRRNPGIPFLASPSLGQLDDLWEVREGTLNLLMVAPSHTANEMIGFGARAVIDPTALSAQAVMDAWTQSAPPSTT